MNKDLTEISNLAKSFAINLSEGKYREAHEIFTDALQLIYSPEWLRENYLEMIDYGDGPPTYIDIGSVDSMEGWATYKEGDVGHAYVVIMGDGFSEAVSLFFKEEHDQPKIREIEWGRP